MRHYAGDSFGNGITPLLSVRRKRQIALRRKGIHLERGRSFVLSSRIALPLQGTVITPPSQPAGQPLSTPEILLRNVALGTVRAKRGDGLERQNAIRPTAIGDNFLPARAWFK